ncbi:hypothetical protein DKX38_006281 [Salix brachista]|uniref:Amino acid transporter transmembrane domain-containing protein n=1 Tax=Salix brachista TaxID=2182728 RepID=A0A5N5N1N7_9ROSI|nr:hypothetical protein DKX38_006281 [Salix brachista]
MYGFHFLVVRRFWGVLSYFAFGEDTKNIIITNLGLGLLSNLVQIGLCINLFFTFPLMMNPVYEEELGWNGLLLDRAYVVFGVIIAVAGT